jgi:hypothetical protein
MHGCGSGAVSDKACFENKKIRLDPDFSVVFNIDLFLDVLLLLVSLFLLLLLLL